MSTDDEERLTPLGVAVNGQDQPEISPASHHHLADHHALDAGSVLGTVQGSSLRSARACARPSGLDGACAQIMSWPLRDGRQSNDA